MSYTEVSRILVPHIVCARRGTVRSSSIEHEGEIGTAYDVSVLPFLLEQLMGLGVADFAVPSVFFAKALDQLHPVLRKRVQKTPNEEKYNLKVTTIFSPLLSEFKLYDLAPGICTYENLFDTVGTPYGAERSKAAKNLAHLYEPIRSFLLAMDKRLQVAIDIDDVNSRLCDLYDISSSPSSRAHISELQNIFSCYDKTSREAFTLKPHSNKDLIRYFKAFVRSASFEEMTTQNFLLGYPAQAKVALRRSGDLLRDLVAQSPFQGLVEWASRLISVGTGIPMPNSAFGKSLIKEDYLPPIISLGAHEEAAKKVWLRVKPPFVPAKSYDVIIEGNELIATTGYDDDLVVFSYSRV